MIGWAQMFNLPQFDTVSGEPVYRQLFEYIRGEIQSGRLARGSKLPATRELSTQLDLNRATIAAAYELLEKEGLIRGQVGRGSYVAGIGPGAGDEYWAPRVVQEPPAEPALPPMADDCVNFTSARPAGDLFPLEDFRASCGEVIRPDDAGRILELGSPHGYAPLRRRLLEQAAERGEAGEFDEVMVTNGCQQALDLLQRVLTVPGDVVAVEDPIYPGLKNLFGQAGVRVVGVKVKSGGMDLDELPAVLKRERIRLIAVTPNFQNPTGATMPLEARRRLLKIARDAGVPIIENDVYGALRYAGEPVASLKSMDETGIVVRLNSFSKIAFPGLRVGWVTARRELTSAMAARKQITDLHSDQLSQAVLLQFMESGRLEAHVARMVEAGRTRLAAALGACGTWLPAGTRWTEPEGGMNVWVSLPEPLDASALLEKACAGGVAYLPAKYFAVGGAEPGGLRLSFAHLPEERIEEGVARLGIVCEDELARARAAWRDDRSPAIV
jgi:2-aminoadipate transaminase